MAHRCLATKMFIKVLFVIVNSANIVPKSKLWVHLFHVTIIYKRASVRMKSALWYLNGKSKLQNIGAT